MAHIPVLLDEVIEHLNVQPGKHYIDATLGGGGYTRAILMHNAPDGKVLGIDWSEEAIARLTQMLSHHSLDAFVSGSEAGSSLHDAQPPHIKGSGPASAHTHYEYDERLFITHGNFAEIDTIITAIPIRPVAGVVFDLGLSSDLLERSGRGFTFSRDEPLVMSFSRDTALSGGLTAKQVVNGWSIEALEEIFREYGDIRQAKKIAEGIASARKKNRIETTGDLRSVVEEVMESATPKILAQVWQAIRIAVNDELGNLERALTAAWEVLESDGRLVVVSFHSLEDRMVKQFFRDKVREGGGTVLTKKPVTPGEDEISRNTRSRSAKLRGIIKT